MNEELSKFINAVISKGHVMESGEVEIRNTSSGFDEMWTYKVRKLKK